jgi:NADPH:quinone reductase-like Zn-dependent oxidoreductase
MLAAQFDRFGPADVLMVREVGMPELKPHEILVRVAASSINPKDTFIRKGRFRERVAEVFPQPVGFDFAGTVERAGSAVEPLPAGSRVWGMLDGWRGGACAEYLAVPSKGCAPMPEELSFVEAAGIPLAALTSLQALRDHGHLRAGHRVCINGASGGVGSYGLQIAKAAGARVTALCSPASAQLCRELGADEIFDYTTTPLPSLPGRYDIVYDVFGNGSFARVRHLLAPRGRYITTVPNLGNRRSSSQTRWSSGRQARLVIVSASRADLDIVAGMVQAGTLRPVIDRVYGLREIAAAERHVETKHTRGKVIVEVGAPGGGPGT